MIDDNDLPVTTEKLTFSNLHIFVDAEGKHGYYDEAGLVGGYNYDTRDQAIFELGKYCIQLNMKNTKPPHTNGDVVEPLIAINGVHLTNSEASTVRFAVESHVYDLRFEFGMDSQSEVMKKWDSILTKMYLNQPVDFTK